MLVEFKEILKMAEDGDFAIPAFNVYNMETVMAVFNAAEACKSPVIMQVYPRLIKEECGYFLAPSILAAAAKASVPVCFHLAHGPVLSGTGLRASCSTALHFPSRRTSRLPPA